MDICTPFPGADHFICVLKKFISTTTKTTAVKVIYNSYLEQLKLI